MTERDQVITVPRTDPIFQIFCWRSDSITLARMRPVLAQLRDIPDQSCQFDKPNGCQPPGLSCMPCAIRRIKTALFGATTPTNGSNRDQH